MGYRRQRLLIIKSGEGGGAVTEDAVALIAGAALNTGVGKTTDTLDLVALDDATLRIMPAQEMFFVENFADGIPITEAMVSFPQLDYPLANLGLTVDGTYLRYIGYDVDGVVQVGSANFFMNQSVAHLGFVLVKVVGGVTTFLDGAAGPRNVSSSPMMASSSLLERAYATTQSNVSVIPNVGAMTFAKSAGVIRGPSINWHGGANIHELPVAGQTPASFTRINPTSAASAALPAASTAFKCDTYWNGVASVAVPNPNNATVQRWLVGFKGGLWLQEGETVYTNLADAVDGIYNAKFSTVYPSDTYAEVARTAAVRSTTDVNNNAQSVTVQTGHVGGSGSGAAGSGPVFAEALLGVTIAPNVVNASLNNLIPAGGVLNVTGKLDVTQDFKTRAGRVVATNLQAGTPNVLDESIHYFFSSAPGAAVVNLPSLATNLGREYWIKNVGGSTLTVAPNGADQLYLASGVSSMVLNPGQWLHIIGGNAYWAEVGSSSGSGILILPASTTAFASMRVPHGVAPAAPVNGDIWTTTTGAFIQINGTTVQFGSTGTGGTDASTLTGATLAANVINASLQNITPASSLLTVGGHIKAFSFTATSGVAPLLASTMVVDYPATYARILSVGPNATTYGNIWFAVTSSDATLYKPVAHITSGGLDITGYLTTSENISVYNLTPKLQLFGTGNADAAVIFQASSGQFNWKIATVTNVVNALEFIPSNAAGGSTYSTTPTMYLTPSVMTVNGQITVVAPGDYVGLNVQRGNRNAGFSTGPNSNEGAFMFLNNGTPTTGKSWHLRSYNSGSLVFFDASTGAEQVTIHSNGIIISGGISANGTNIFHYLSGNTADNNIALIENVSTLGYGVKLHNGNDARYALAVLNAASNALNIQLWGDGQAYFAGPVSTGGILSSGNITSNNGGLDNSGFFLNAGAGAHRSSFTRYDTLGAGSTLISSYGNVGVMVGATGGAFNTGLLVGNFHAGGLNVVGTVYATVNASVGGAPYGPNSLFTIRQNHGTQDGIEFIDTNAAPFDSWTIGLGSGDGVNGLGFYNRTLPGKVLGLFRTGVTVGGVLTVGSNVTLVSGIITTSAGVPLQLRASTNTSVTIGVDGGNQLVVAGYSPVAINTGLKVTGGIEASGSITLNNSASYSALNTTGTAYPLIFMYNDNNVYRDSGGGGGHMYDRINGTTIGHWTSAGLTVAGGVEASSGFAIPTSATVGYGIKNTSGVLSRVLWGFSDNNVYIDNGLGGSSIYLRPASNTFQFSTGGFVFNGDIVQNGVYHNFTNIGGDTGMGIRNNGGIMEFKNFGGSWVPIPTSGGGGGGVSSVGLAGAQGVSVTGSPILSAGTMTVGLGNITPNRVDSATYYTVGGVKVVGSQGGALPNLSPTGTYSSDVGNIANCINQIVDRLRTHGLVAP